MATKDDMSALGLPVIVANFAELADTDGRFAFDRLGWEFLARAGRLAHLVVEATGRTAGGGRRPLTLDEAVAGGLMVRTAKLLRGLFDATQSDESESHHILARCIVETAANMLWLLQENSPEQYRRFRADSFATWLQWLEQTKVAGDAPDPIRQRVQAHVERELAAAGLQPQDVPKRPNAWGLGSLRQRLRAVGLERLYLMFFATHSYYVHGSWHELRTFHLKTDGEGMHLDMTFGEIGPPMLYETVRVVLQATTAYADRMLLSADADAIREICSTTQRGIQQVELAFADFVARGALDDVLDRHNTGEAQS